MHKWNVAAVSLLLFSACLAGCGGATTDESDDVEAAAQPTMTAESFGGDDDLCGEAHGADVNWVHGMLAALDSADLQTWASYLGPNVTFMVGNGPSVSGRDNVVAACSGLVGLATSMHHQVHDIWRHPGGITIQGDVVVVRASDGATVTLPFVDVLATDHHHRVTQYFIYMDPTPIFQQ